MNFRVFLALNLCEYDRSQNGEDKDKDSKKEVRFLAMLFVKLTRTLLCNNMRDRSV